MQNNRHFKVIEAIDVVIHELIMREDENSSDYKKTLEAELTLFDLREDFESLIGQKIPNTYKVEG